MTCLYEKYLSDIPEKPRSVHFAICQLPSYKNMSRMDIKDTIRMDRL